MLIKYCPGKESLVKIFSISFFSSFLFIFLLNSVSLERSSWKKHGEHFSGFNNAMFTGAFLASTLFTEVVVAASANNFRHRVEYSFPRRFCFKSLCAKVHFYERCVILWINQSCNSRSPANFLYLKQPLATTYNKREKQECLQITRVFREEFHDC